MSKYKAKKYPMFLDVLASFVRKSEILGPFFPFHTETRVDNFFPISFPIYGQEHLTAVRVLPWPQVCFIFANCSLSNLIKTMKLFSTLLQNLFHLYIQRWIDKKTIIYCLNLDSRTLEGLSPKYLKHFIFKAFISFYK